MIEDDDRDKHDEKEEEIQKKVDAGYILIFVIYGIIMLYVIASTLFDIPEHFPVMHVENPPIPKVPNVRAPISGPVPIQKNGNPALITEPYVPLKGDTP